MSFKTLTISDDCLDALMWRRHSCLPRRHSCRRPPSTVWRVCTMSHSQEATQ